VEHRQKGQQAKRRKIDLGDRQRVFGCGTTQLEAHLGIPKIGGG
jgi:hypothetical protein